MANYQYDESGILASYFILTFLSLILVPLTLSFIPLTSSSKFQLITKITNCLLFPLQKHPKSTTVTVNPVRINVLDSNV